MQVNLNTLVVIALLFLVIIVLSSVKLCNIPANKSKQTKDELYKEAFEDAGDPNIFQELVRDNIYKTISQQDDQLEQDRQIDFLENEVKKMENKLATIQKMYV